MSTQEVRFRSTDLFPLPAEPRGDEDWTDGWSDVRSFAEIVLWTVAIASLVVVAWSYLDARIYQHQAAAELAAAAATLPPGETSATGPAGILHVAAGTPIGELEIPRLDLSVVVAEGTDENVLGVAVGRLSSSAVPGDGGNLALAGHRDTFFRPLEDIQPGDRIVFRAAGGREMTFEVDWTRIVDPSETWVVAPTLESVITLVTCYPFRYVGTAPERFVVRGRLVSS